MMNQSQIAEKKGFKVGDEIFLHFAGIAYEITDIYPSQVVGKLTVEHGRRVNSNSLSSIEMRMSWHKLTDETL
jgi:hypothetical protein